MRWSNARRRSGRKAGLLAPPPLPPGPPEAKKQKLDNGGTLQPEVQWLATHPGAATLKVKLPSVSTNDKLNGEILEIDVESLTMSVQAFKQMLSPKLGLAPNKQKLQVATVGFLKDNLSLAHYNLSEESLLSLCIKERGGRKK